MISTFVDIFSSKIERINRNHLSKGSCHRFQLIYQNGNSYRGTTLARSNYNRIISMLVALTIVFSIYLVVAAINGYLFSSWSNLFYFLWVSLSGIACFSLALGPLFIINYYFGDTRNLESDRVSPLSAIFVYVIFSFSIAWAIGAWLGILHIHIEKIYDKKCFLFVTSCQEVAKMEAYVTTEQIRSALPDTIVLSELQKEAGYLLGQEVLNSLTFGFYSRFLPPISKLSVSRNDYFINAVIWLYSILVVTGAANALHGYLKNKWSYDQSRLNK